MAIFGLPGGAEWWIILGIILLLFGPTQLPKLAKTFGKSAKVLKDSVEGKIEDDDEADQPSSSKKDTKAEADDE
ncbi:MAG: twin-arginine translocase TatA/TatE family subunit [Coriobacteriia bacterium]|nr:twin-arginine translocase TatA/TatE family subunit [Coriobacteriia bacterium]